LCPLIPRDIKEHELLWSTVGVSENVIEASWLALVDSVEYKIYKDEGEAVQPGVTRLPDELRLQRTV